MAKAASAGGATPLRGGLPEEIIVWEILVCLPPKSLPPLPLRLPRLASRHLHQRLPPGPPRPPTGGYRLLLLRTPADLPPKDQIGCYVITLGSDQPPRYIGGLEVAASGYLNTPALLRDSLHWYPVHYQSDLLQRQAGSELVIAFDTMSESFWQMRAPVVPTKSYIFEMDATLGIYNHNDAKGTVDIWVLQNYESEVWDHEYRVKLPVAEIKGQFGRLNDNWVVSAVSVDGDVLLLVSHGGWMFYVDTDGELVDNFYRDGQIFYACELRLKQTLVPHTFFTALEGYAVNAPPFV